MNRTLRYAVLVPLAIFAFYLLFVARGINLGWAGNLAVFAGAWLVWYLLWATLRASAAAAETDDAMAPISPAEQRSWVGLIFSVGILVYFALHSTQMVAADGAMAPAASATGRHIAMLVIFWIIVMQVLRKRWRDRVEHDERDHIIQARANHWARIGLSVFVFAVAMMFAFSPPDRLAWAQPMVISNMMIFGLIGTSVLEYAITSVSYWRDRH